MHKRLAKIYFWYFSTGKYVLSTPHRRNICMVLLGTAAGHLFMVTFLLNGEVVNADVKPFDTLLTFLRQVKGLTGTKEGCNEGDCGACSIIVTDRQGVTKSINSCIALMPQIHGKAVRTVEGVSSPDDELHPIQTAMIKNHGSQCGYCTPGFITTLAVAHKNGEKDFEAQLAGNLCRCTGYGPILMSAEEVSEAAVPNWMQENLVLLKNINSNLQVPQTINELANLYVKNPTAKLVAGATDLSLEITKKLNTLNDLIFLSECSELKRIIIEKHNIKIGAACTISDLIERLSSVFPHFCKMLLRYGGVQVRNSATIGGNIANGSPIGDGSPALIALNARLNLRKGKSTRSLPIEEFFIDYGVQDLMAAEFIESIDIPQTSGSLKCYKVTKRFDQDISAVCGCFLIKIINNKVTECRIAFGGMAATPKRALKTEKTLLGFSWTINTIKNAMNELKQDFSPIDDMRASSYYRLKIAQNLLLRLFHEETNELLETRDAR